MTKHKGLAALSVAVAAVGFSLTSAFAAPINQPPPLSPIFDLDGQALPHVYTQYTTSFVAAVAATNISFAMREDPAFIFLDDITMVDLTTASGNLLVNGDFESGPVGSSTPAGWTYLNIFGATFGGVVASNNPHSGANNYYDGAVQAYDAITQIVATNPGDTYQISFWMSDNSGLTTFSRLSTNGNVTNTGGNGADLLVYATQGNPRAATVPEPSSLLLIGMGMLGLLGARRRRVA